MTRTFLLLGAGAVAAVAAYAFLAPAAQDQAAPPAPLPNNALVTINMPEIAGNAAIGQRIFDSACAACHGQGGVGNDGAGPPLIHKIYEPGHHADEAFQRAVALGVPSHHWRFGNMPPVKGLTRGDVAMIITYIRDIQRANGIH